MDNKIIDRFGEYRFCEGLVHSEKTMVNKGLHIPTGEFVSMALLFELGVLLLA